MCLHEKNEGKLRPEHEMAIFRNALLDNNLYDLEYFGDKFIWSNKHGDCSFTNERLDRFLANSL